MQTLMRAFVCQQYGQPSQLQLKQVNLPEPGADEVRVQIVAAGVNYPDLLSIAGEYPIPSKPPFIPGVEGAGVVIACGPDVTHVRVGDRVCCQNNVVKGSFAEEIVLPEAGLAIVPSGINLQQAACIPTTYGTAHFALTHRAALQAGETVLIHGASGGVGSAAVQLAKAMGAFVIATTSSNAKAASLRQLGADEVINTQTPNLRDAILQASPQHGVDIALDPVGGELFDVSVRVLRPYGRLLTVGYTSGVFPSVKANILLVKAISVIGVNYGHYLHNQPHNARDAITNVLAKIKTGHIQPRIDASFTFEQVPAALEHLTSRQVVGKIVITIRPDLDHDQTSRLA